MKLILTLQFFSSDIRLLSFYTFERYCSKLFILNENENKQFLKKFFSPLFRERHRESSSV